MNDQMADLESLEWSQKNLKQDLMSGTDADVKVRWEGLA